MLNQRERFLDRNNVEAIAKPSGLKLLITGAPRLGDILFAFPALEHLLASREVKNLGVLLYGYAAPILAGLSGRVSRIELPSGSWNIFEKWRMLQSIRKNNFDAAIVLDEKRAMRRMLAKTNIPTILVEPSTGSSKTGQHLRTMQLSFPIDFDLAGAVEPIPTVRLDQESLAWAKSKLASAGRPRIAFHVGCRRITRKQLSWHEVDRTATKLWLLDRFLELGRMLIKELAAAIVMVGSGASERLIAEEFRSLLGPSCINAVDWGDSLQTAALLKQTNALVASDGGILHLATAVGIKCVAIWGPTPLELFAPTGLPGTIKVLQKEVSCSPCKKTECSDKICLSSISAHEAFIAIIELLGPDIG